MPKKPTDERIAKLEAKRAKVQRAIAEPAVVIAEPNEHISDARARIEASGRKSPCLLVPAIPDVETFERQCSHYQRWILARCAGINDADFAGPTAEEISDAYRRSLTA